MSILAPLKLLALLCLPPLLAACGNLPVRPPDTAAPIETAGTQLARMTAPLLAQHPRLTGLYPLEHGRDALLVRLALAAAAQKAIDIQYYIWHDDLTGRLMMAKLLEAADRGVRVRILLDDLGANADDDILLALDAHPNVEIRLFNPTANRHLRRLSALLDLKRVNQRMHNKTFIADRQATIVGGRNIGDEYFAANPEIEFSDLDVLCIGPVVPQVQRSFDLFWRHELAIPIRLFYPDKPLEGELEKVRADYRKQLQDERAQAYLQALAKEATETRLKTLQLPFYWGRARALYDHPDKLDPDEDATLLAERLAPVAQATRRELSIVSPYFIPGEGGVTWMRALEKMGVTVKVLTNSLAATDVALVHAGYAKYRKPLLESGVQLYELKPDPPQAGGSGAGSGGGRGSATRGGSGFGSGIGFRGSSRASLHSKAFVFDRRNVFIGSLNLDPRSIELNTEIGVLFESELLGQRMAEQFDRLVARDAYTLSLDGQGRVRWQEGDGRDYDSEPKSSSWRRFNVWLFSLLPLESQL
ncbi:phospholipase D family protein [Chitiniphilus purpureus]|uniref:Phospholipase D family protein n=1 Tax=Chitiniphilus purpureus TaxID=2981137 RepID=A0ABY6DL43_9NEIS|nr:phospholipase D family protein [Chitiniphilus sp. CD1]UXY15080.1 phospholipase D family protein [Chitiniphilus sp. CD1]